MCRRFDPGPSHQLFPSFAGFLPGPLPVRRIADDDRIADAAFQQDLGNAAPGDLRALARDDGTHALSGMSERVVRGRAGRFLAPRRHRENSSRLCAFARENAWVLVRRWQDRRGSRAKTQRRKGSSDPFAKGTNQSLLHGRYRTPRCQSHRAHSLVAMGILRDGAGYDRLRILTIPERSYRVTVICHLYGQFRACIIRPYPFGTLLGRSAPHGGARCSTPEGGGALTCRVPRRQIVSMDRGAEVAFAGPICPRAPGKPHLSVGIIRG